MKKKSAGHTTSRQRLEAMRVAGTGSDPAVLREARRVFDNVLTRQQQLAIAEEIVLTRSAELCLAYPNVMRVSFGHRRERHPRSGRHRIVAKPCVRFVVTDKWRGRREDDTEGRIPPRLLAFCWVRGERKLCAVPTDVEDAAPHLSVRAQGERIVAEWNGVPEFGAIACAVKRSTLPDRVYGLGCRHVLSLSSKFFDEPTWGALVYVGSQSSSTIVGRTRAIAGDLGATDSFDAQLVEASDRTALQKALLATGLMNYAEDSSQLPTTYNIVTPNRTIAAAFVDFIDGQYDVDGHTIGHPRLVQSQPETGTDPGESGSPIVSKDGRTLLGMHVAGWAGLDPQRQYLTISYMIPAWELFNPANYSNASNQEIWTIVKP